MMPHINNSCGLDLASYSSLLFFNNREKQNVFFPIWGEKKSFFPHGCDKRCEGFHGCNKKKAVRRGMDTRLAWICVTVCNNTTSCMHRKQQLYTTANDHTIQDRSDRHVIDYTVIHLMHYPLYVVYRGRPLPPLPPPPGRA